MSRTGYNNLVVKIFQAFSTTERDDPGNELARAKIRSCSKGWPGGLYRDALVYIPRDATKSMTWQGQDRIVIYNGLKLAWEGAISYIGREVGEGAQQGIWLECTGQWGNLLGATTWDKRWADTLISADVWRENTTSNGAELASVDRKNRLRVTPKAEAWANGDFYALTYTMPVGETVRRITYNYDLQEAGQAWEISVWRSTDGSSYTQMTNASGETYSAGTTTVIAASGTGSIDVVLATASRYVEFRFYARAAQTPTADGTYYGEWSSVVMYSETDAAITASVIAADVVGKVSNLNSDVSNIGAPAVTLEPFLTNGPEAMNSILTRAARFGDGSFNSWAAHLRESEVAASPDGKPVLFLEQYPALTSHDYAIRIDERNLVPPFRIVQDFDGIVNWVALEYRDEANDRNVILTPDDDASLKDTTSITDWGERHLARPLNLGVCTQALALNIGQRILAQRKDPKFLVSGPINVLGYIRDSNNSRVPTSQIMPGKRLKVENYLEDLAYVSAAGLTFHITQIDYDDSTETASITTGGQPDDLAVILAQMQIRDDRLLV